MNVFHELILVELLATLLFTIGAAAIAVFYLYGQMTPPAHSHQGVSGVMEKSK